MSLISLKAVNFRSFDEIFLEAVPGLNILLGKNGSGKTSILEALSYLCFSKSFRTHNDLDMLKNGKDYFQLKAHLKIEGRERILQANFMRREGKRFLRDGVGLERLSDVVGVQPLVIQSPEDIRITLGGSKEKRLYFNRLISQITRGFLDDLILYNRLLKQRNAYLKIIREKNGSYDTQLEIYDEQLAEVNYNIFMARKELLKIFNEHFREIFRSFHDGCNEGTQIVYHPNLHIEDRERYSRKYLEKSRDRSVSEINLSRTLQGSNYDKIKFIRFNRDMENSASQGEHKIWMTLMKLTEGRLLQENHSEEALFLFDDLFSELDLQRSAAIIEKVRNYRQVFITGTDLSDIRRHGMDIDENIVKVFKF